MTKNEFGLKGESLVAKKLDTMNIKYWWSPAQQNYYGADFLTEHGIIDVKIARPQIIGRFSRKSNKMVKKKIWKFNCHHHGKKQNYIDFFIFIVMDYGNTQSLYFIMPKELCGGHTFHISARQIETGRFDYFLNAWDILNGSKSKNIPEEPQDTTHIPILNTELLAAYKLKGWRAYELAEKAGIERTRFCRIVSKKLKPTTEEKQNLSKILRRPQRELF